MDKKELKFSPHLFWDVEAEELDVDKHKEFIVARVLDYGSINDWLMIKNYYTLTVLAEIAKSIRSLMPKSLSFIAAVTDTSITDVTNSTVLPSTLKLLIRLQKTGVLKSTRLAGGTALALQLGHRMSVDLDFFGRVEGDSETIFETLSQDGFQVVPEMNSKNIHICQINGIKVDIVNYKHPWIDGMV